MHLGAYERYGGGTSIENNLALRFYSSCNCYHVDVGYRDSNASDKERFDITFNFTGLGDVAQNLSVDKRSQQQQAE